MTGPSVERLQAYLRDRAAELARRAEMIWRLAEPLHKGQTRPDKDRGGASHCRAVEQNAWQLILAAGQLDQFHPIELFLLSIAACCHDFDKGLKSVFPDKFRHGEGSGWYVVEHSGHLLLEAPEATAVDCIVSLHDRLGVDFVTALDRLPEEGRKTVGPNLTVDLRRLCVLLKAADVLHTDSSRVPPPSVDVARLTGLDRAKHLARSCIHPWKAQGNVVVLPAYPQDLEQEEAVRAAFEYLRENEWQPLVLELRAHRFPYRLQLDLEDRNLVRALTVAGTAERRLPGMDYYHREDEALLAGRDDDVRALKALAFGHPCSAVVGPSGVGKSSVLHAGLAPAVERLSGWRCLITRPDKQTGRFFTPATFREVLGHKPASEASLADLCAQALRECEKLLVVLDQFEDAAYFGLLDVEAVAGEILGALAGQPNLRVMLAYRDDVASVIGPLENAVAQSARGLPRHFVQRLSASGAEATVDKLLASARLRLEPAEEFRRRLLADLAAATQKEARAPGEAVYPPYVQMALERLVDLAEKGEQRVVRLEDYLALAKGPSGPMEQIIVEYLTRNVEKLAGLGHEVTPARRVLVALARTSGSKGAADAARVAAEAQVPPDVLSRLLPDMATLRLVRRLESNQWEIAHDLLARRVAEDLIDDERRFKRARESLEHKARSYGQHRSPLTAEELRDLWLNRSRVPPEQLDDQERLLILISIFAPTASELLHRPDMVLGRHASDQPYGAAPAGHLGWYWLGDLPESRFGTLLAHAAALDEPLSCEAFQNGSRLVSGSCRLKHVIPSVRSTTGDLRTQAIHAILQSAHREEVSFVRESLKDEDDYVRRAAVEAIAKLGSATDLPLLRELLPDVDWWWRGDVVEVIARFGSAEELPLLRGLLKDEGESVRRAVVEAIAKLGSATELPLLRELLKDEAEAVRRAGVEAIAKLGSAEELPLLRERLKDKYSAVRQAAVAAIAKLGSAKDVPFLRRSLKDENDSVRRAAIEAITRLGSAKDLPLLWELLKEESQWVRRAAVDAIVKLGSTKDLPLLREWLQHETWCVRAAVVEAIAKLGSAKDLPLLRERLKDTYLPVRRAAVGAIAKLGSAKDLPFLHPSLKDEYEEVRRAAVEAIARLAPTAGLLEELAPALLSDDSDLAMSAAATVGQKAPRDAVLAFLADHQHEMTIEALAVLDWYLYAPPYAREAWDRRWAKKEEEKRR